ncbi:type II toxin-antitoxin system HicB family antitoxin [Frankia gtarii]|uniref:type II toxin-antitoxin system HicB family antitoxin n=1 Tax=Frankia gtarii TaxID=2950102 RepID=UPI0021C0E199|nr:type II toxin-antitoxin system HicB family antitoxin [Frankia gtarii]
MSRMTTRTITLRLSAEAYESVRRHAEADHISMNAWIEGVLDGEDMRRRCAAHGAWIRANPAVAQAALAFGEANQQALAATGHPTLTDTTP